MEAEIAVKVSKTTQVRDSGGLDIGMASGEKDTLVPRS